MSKEHYLCPTCKQTVSHERDWMIVGEPPTCRSIILRVAKRYGIRAALLSDGPTGRFFSGPRHLAMWLCCRLVPDVSLQQIARHFARHHTSVLFARQKLDRAHAEGKLAAPRDVWRSLISGEDERDAA